MKIIIELIRLPDGFLYATYGFPKKGSYFIANEGVHLCVDIKEGDYPYATIQDGAEICHFRAWKTKVIGTTNPSLNLPLIPTEDDEEKFLLNLIDITWGQACNDVSVPSTKWAREILVMAGYKSNKARKYSGDEMIDFAREVLSRKANNDLRNIGDIFKDYSSRISPSLKAIEIEMEDRQFSYSGAFKAAMDRGEEMQIPKLTIYNYLVVSKFIYQ